MTTATYQQIFLCPPAKNMTTNCSKLRQPDLLDNTGKNTIVDNPSQTKLCESFYSKNSLTGVSTDC